MLHNNGHYGPNEVPVNMGAPVNVSQLSAPINVVQTFNNLGRSPQNTPQTAAGHLTLSNYPSYAGAPHHLGSQMQNFPNYQGLGLQPNYMPENSPVVPNFSWPNGMLPVNSNANNQICQNVSNYPHSDRILPEIDSTTDQNHSPKVCLNVPQVSNNFFQRQIENEGNEISNFNKHFKPFDNVSEDADTKPQSTLLNDNNRRKNLENTVRLIEDILISTTKNREIELENELRHCNDDNEETVTENKDTVITTETSEEKDEATLKMLPESPNTTDDSDSQVDMNSSNSIDEKTLIENDVKTGNSENTTENLNITVKLEPDDPDDPDNINEVEVKIEPISSWTDTENTAPFHRDVNGVLQDEVGCANIVDSETSIAEATKVIENNEQTDSFFECPYCSLLFVHPKRFLIHTKWHVFGLNNEKRVVLAKEKESRKKLRESKQAGKARRTWPCKDCDKVFHARGGLESHRKRYHTNRTRECKICCKLITGWGPWRSHLATHNTDSGFQCPHCPKRFKHSNSLAKHRDTHLEKTHECPECPKKFGSPALLKVHMKSHERVQKGASFHCSFCGKAFFDKFNLQIHERTHTNERPFVCMICTASFVCNSNLRRHMKVSHSSNKPYECATCRRSFASEGIRDRHAQRAHGDPDDFTYVCDLCPNRYMKRIELKKHIYKVHPKSKSKESAADDK